jgi:nitrogen regulatory protein PII
MKKLSMVVHSSLQQELADLLRSMQLDNFMFSHIEEHSAQLEHDVFLSARDKVVGYVPQVRVEVILESERITSLLQDLRSARCTFKGKCFYWVTDIDEAGEL